MAGNGHIQIDDLGAVQLSVGVDSGSLEAARTQIEKLVEELQKKCKLSLTIDTVAAQNALSQLQNRQSRAASNASKHVGLTAPLRRQRDRELSGHYVRDIERYTAAIDIAQKKIDQGFKAPDVKTAISNLQRLLDQYKITGEGANDLKVAMDTLNSAMAGSKSASKLRDTLSATLTPEWFKAQESRLTSQYANADPAMLANAQQALAKVKEFGSAAELTDEKVEALNRALAVYKSRMAELGTSNTAVKAAQDEATAIANLKAQYEDYMSKYGQNLQRNLPLMEKFRKFGADLSSGALTGNAATQQFAALREEARKSGVEIETVRQRMTHLFGQHFNTALIMLAIRGLRMALRQLWQDIKEVNEALVQTQIVTGLTGAALEAYTDKAYAAADKSKDKVTNILSEATAFGRLGYDSDLAVQLAQLTSMYSKLGDVDTSDATDAITALMKAFDLKNADEIELALDKMIYVGNNFPISAAGLGEGLNNAASALSSAGNSLEQTLALLMAANATVQNPSKSSTAMRTITARIRNTKAELEELGEELDEKYNTVAKYRKELLGLTGVDILDATGKNFRATYDILKDLADVWGTLTSAQQAAVTTMLAGTRNQDIFASLMKNFPSAEEAMGGMGDAAGLMDEKFKAVEDSLSGALSGLSNAWSKFSNTLVNSGDVVSFVKLLTSLVGVFEKLAKTMGGGAMITGALALTSFFMKMRQFNSVWPQMQAAITSLNGMSGLGGGFLSSANLNAVTNALSGFTNAQQRAVMSAAGMGTAAQAQVLEFQGMSTAGLQAGFAMSSLGASLDGLKMKMQSFVASGNVWITIFILIAQAILSLINIINQNREAAKQAAEEAKQAEKDARQAQTDAIKATQGVISSFDDGANSVDRYIDRLEQAEEKLKNAQIGSQLYKDANLELYSVQKDIVDIFGKESGAIRGVNEDLKDYANRLDEIARRKQYTDLFSGENYAGTAAALELFGVSPEGKSQAAKSSVFLDKIKINSDWYTYASILNGLYWETEGRQEAWDSALRRILGDELEYAYDATFNEAHQWIDFSRQGFVDQAEDFFLTDTSRFDEITIDSISFTGDARKVVDSLMRRIDYFSSIGDTKSATIVSNILNQYKESIGYDDALQIFQTWASGRILYGEAQGDLAQPYYDLLTTKNAYDSALLSGNVEGARSYLIQYLDLLDDFIDLANEKGYEWAAQFAQGIVSGLDNVDLVRDILSGKLRTNLLVPTGDGYLKFYASSIFADPKMVDQGIASYDHDLIGEDILAASIFKSREEAVERGMSREYIAYTRLASAAEVYGTTVEHLLMLLSQYYGLQMSATSQGSYTFSTFHNNAGSGLDVKDPFTNESVLGATSSVASVKEASDKLFNAEAVRDRIREAWDSGKEIAQEDIDAIKEYVGDTFDEIDEDVLASIDATLDESRDEISTSIEGLANNAIEWMQENVDGFNLADYIDTDGNIDFSGIIAAFQNSGVENAAGAAGANASMSYLSNLQTVGGASIRARLTEDGLGYVTEFSGGTAGDSTTTKPRGGGGGHHSQISDDIDNVERLIKLFKELLNYYDEGSEQWIARQRQIIDKYKAGVEIAMAEYDRLIKKGLKQTDEDVKKIVDTILEYQGDIFEESKKLWEAVRQNQIDALKHTKDQIDATIELEKTHHDLLIAIRNERRELEDELKAARDAYSEVMTPEELDALFSADDYAELMDKLAGIEGDAMALYRDYKEQIAAVSEDETYMIEHITDEFKRQYDLKMKEYEITKAELGVRRAQQELENVRNEQTVMMLIDGRWQWVADPEKVLEAEQALADAEQELADAQDEYDFQSLIHEMEAQSSGIQQQIDALEALTFSMDELAEQIHLFSDSVYKELLTYLSKIAQATFDKYDGDTAIPQFETGGATRRGGLAVLHPNETIFNSTDAAKLWSLVHDLDVPVSLDGVLSAFARRLISTSPVENQATQPTVIDNSINIPGGIHVQGETAQQLIALLKSVVAPYQP